MLEQQNTDDVLNLENIEERKENAINILEKARVYHEKYLLRCNSADLESAVSYYIQAIKQNPKIPETYYRLACLLFENGQISLDSAIEQCKMAVEEMPLEADLLYLFASLYKELKNKDNYIKLLKLALENSSTFSGNVEKLKAEIAEIEQ